MSGIFYSDLFNELDVNSDNITTGTITIGGDMDLSAATIIGNLIPNATETYTIGNTTNLWENIYVSNINSPNISVDTITNYTLDGNLTLQATNGSGYVFVNGDLNVAEVVTCPEVTSTGSLQIHSNGILLIGNTTYPPHIESAIVTGYNQQFIFQYNGTGPYLAFGCFQPSSDINIYIPNTTNGNVALASTATNITQYFNDTIQTNNLQTDTITTYTPSGNLSINENGTNTNNLIINMPTIVNNTLNVNNPSFFNALVTDTYLNLTGGTNQLSFQPGGTGNSYYITTSTHPLSTNVSFTLPYNVGTGNIAITSGSVNSNQIFNNAVSTTSLYANSLVPFNISSLTLGTNTTTLTTPSLAALNTVVTDSSSNLTTLQYTAGAIPSTICCRDISGSCQFYDISLTSPTNQITFFPGTLYPFFLTAGNYPSSGSVSFPRLYGYASAILTNTYNQTQQFADNTDSINNPSLGAVTFTGGIGIGQSMSVSGSIWVNGGINLNNNVVSYSPSTLNYYEEFSQVCQFYCGAGAISTTVTINLVKIGLQVTMSIAGFNISSSSTASNAILLTGATYIPTRFCISSANLYVVGTCRINFVAAGTYWSGLVMVAGNGNIEIYNSPQLNNYPTSSAIIIEQGITCSWIAGK